MSDQTDTHTCPVRDDGVTNADRWEPCGSGRTCSYCGSLHPDEIMPILDAAFANPDAVRVSVAGGKHKAFIRRRGAADPADASVSYRFAHGRSPEVIAAIYRAAQITRQMAFREYTP